jgi:diaminopimelate decarboxylase
MQSRLQIDEISKVFSSALKNKNILGPDDTSAVFYDLALIESRISGLNPIFPGGTLHAVAVKANPLTRVLGKLRAMGAGAEVASLP